MFRKPFATNQAHKISGADRKKLKRSLEKAYPHLSEADVDALVPGKAGEAEQVKVASPSRTVIYTLDGVPIFLDTSGKGDFAPTVFSLWKVPHLLRRVWVKHPAVTQFIIGGADLMLPGVDVAPEDSVYDKDALVAVCVHGNPAPLAVGYAAMSSAEARQRAAAGAKGKLVAVLHHFGDQLWAGMGGRAGANEGYFENMVVPLGSSVAAQEAEYGDGMAADGGGDSEGRVSGDGGGSAGEEEGEEDNVEDERQRHGRDAAAAEAAEGGGDATDALAERLGQVATVSGSDGDGGGGGGGGGAVTGVSAAAASSAADMDALLEMVLLQALHKSIKDGDLPLAGSALWSQRMLTVKQEAVSLDLKRSRHKKMSKFLQHYAKEGLLSTKEDKFSGDVVVTAVNRQHILYTTYRPYKMAGGQLPGAGGGGAEQGAPGGPAGAAAAAGRAGGGAAGGQQSQLVIEEVYKPVKDARGIFESIGRSPDSFYTAAEVAEVVFAYVKHANLESNAPDERTIVLDPYLCDALFKGVLKKGEPFPTLFPKAQLRETFLKRLQQQTRISRGGMQVVKKGGAPSVDVTIEKRQGNKRVTRIVGLEAFLADPEQVAAACQKKFATATTMSPLPGKQATGVEVVVQGAVAEKLPDWLAADFGIPKRYVHVPKADAK